MLGILLYVVLFLVITSCEWFAGGDWKYAVALIGLTALLVTEIVVIPML